MAQNDPLFVNHQAGDLVRLGGPRNDQIGQVGFKVHMPGFLQVHPRRMRARDELYRVVPKYDAILVSPGTEHASVLEFEFTDGCRREIKDLQVRWSVVFLFVIVFISRRQFDARDVTVAMNETHLEAQERSDKVLPEH